MNTLENTKKTLSKAETSKFFTIEDGYELVEKAWKQAVADKVELDIYDHFIYAVLRGKDWRKGLTLISNGVKLENGQMQPTTKVLYRLEHSNQIYTERANRLYGDFIMDNIGKLLRDEIMPKHYQWKEKAYN